MAFKITERFEVQAPVERVWKYLIDPASVVQCLPGAELLETQDDRNFLGAIKVKVGPLAMSYKGKASFTEVNDETHTVRMVGEAREVGGSGSTKVTMVSVVMALEGGGSEVSVDSEINLVGRIVQFGRGMIEEVSRQMFRQFAACVKSRLETPDEPQIESSAAEQNSAPRTASPTPSAPPETKAVAAAPLAFNALWAIIARFFKRLFGKHEETTTN
jgi:carbon monoxide dehydrogenase subunit G